MAALAALLGSLALEHREGDERADAGLSPGASGDPDRPLTRRPLPDRSETLECVFHHLVYIGTTGN